MRGCPALCQDELFQEAAPSSLSRLAGGLGAPGKVSTFKILHHKPRAHFDSMRGTPSNETAPSKTRLAGGHGIGVPGRARFFSSVSRARRRRTPTVCADPNAPRRRVWFRDVSVSATPSLAPRPFAVGRLRENASRAHASTSATSTTGPRGAYGC